MEFDEILSSPAFWILSLIGCGAFAAMLFGLKMMGNSEIMPLWVKIITFLLIPVVAAAFAGYASDN